LGYERFRVERFGAVSGVSIDAIFALGSRVATGEFLLASNLTEP